MAENEEKKIRSIGEIEKMLADLNEADLDEHDFELIEYGKHWLNWVVGKEEQEIKKRIDVEYEIGNIYVAPRACPKCGCQKAEFRTTATNYGEWWLCISCGFVFGTKEFDTGLSNFNMLLERLIDLESRVAKLTTTRRRF